MGREKLADAVKQIAWGYVLFHVNINLGSFNLLPNWLGYILILGVLSILGESEPSALLLRPLGMLLAVWEGLLWGLTVFGVSFDSTILRLITAAVSLYFHFQLLTDLADLAGRFCCPERRKILHLRTAKTLFITVFSLPVPWARYMSLSMGVIVVNLIVALWICSVLFSLRHALEENQLPPHAPTGEVWRPEGGHSAEM